jgi:hypothetical protein
MAWQQTGVGLSRGFEGIDHSVPMQFRPEIPALFTGIGILEGSFSALDGALAP